MYIMGIDQSYNSTGIVIINDKRELVHAEKYSCEKKNDIFERAWDVAQYLNTVAKKYNPKQIGLEGLAFGMRGDATRDLAGLQFTIVTVMQIINKWPLELVAPTTVKKTATGKGNSKKEKMLDFLPEEVLSYFKGLGVRKTTGLLDLNDAYWIAITLANKSDK